MKPTGFLIITRLALSGNYRVGFYERTPSGWGWQAERTFQTEKAALYWAEACLLLARKRCWDVTIFQEVEV